VADLGWCQFLVGTDKGDTLNKPAWASFWILGFIWGSSFLLIRVGVEEMPATQLVLVRCAIAAIGLNAVLYLRGRRLPTDRATVRAFIINGLGNTVLPYTLISLSQQTITSGMGAVLQATASLFTLVIAHFAFADERITWRKIIGLLIGFAGVAVLSSASIDAGQINVPMLLGQLAMIGASLCYAIFTVYSRQIIRRNIEPMVVSSGTFIAATVFALVFMLLEPLVGGRAFIPFSDLPSDTVLAVVGLGIVNTFIAYMFFYYIVRELGAFRAVMVTYIVPPVGLILGWLVLNERVETYMLMGAAMILTGIGIINVRLGSLRRSAARAVETT
jgi:drug/metabolite transporter (DMT)-like permease